MRLDGKFKGRLINSKTGEITCWEKHNKITQSGFNWIGAIMSTVNNRPAPITHIAFGTDSSETTSETTALGNEVYRAPVTAAWDSTENKLTFTGSIPVNSGVEASIAEAGLFNAETGGVLFDRAFFTPKGIDANLSFDYEFEITVTP